MVKKFKEINIPSKLAVFDYIFPQFISLPKTILNFMLKSAKIESIKKLQKCCRYFYAKFPYNIVDNFSIAEHFKIDCYNYDLKIKDSLTHLLKNNLYLSQTLYIFKDIPENIFTKITKCDIYQLRIYGSDNFLITDFQHLTKSGTLKNVILAAYVYYLDGTKVPLEEVLFLLPNVQHFYHDPCLLTSKTAENLLLFKRNVKFETFHIRFDFKFPDIHLFCQFIKNTFDLDIPTSRCHDRFSLMGRKDDMQQFYQFFKTVREKCHLNNHHEDIKWLAVY